MNEQALNFHMTFPPAPIYIGRLLKIADGRERSIQEISEETGIPTGESSGKVKPHIAYARYMGLIEEGRFARTPLGDVVFSEDPMVSETLSHLICHVMLTALSGAELWRFIMRELLPENGGAMKRGDVDLQVTARYQRAVKTGQVFTTYTGQFTALSFLAVEGEQVALCPMQPDRDMRYVYALALLRDWRKAYPDAMEITAVQLDSLLFNNAFAWDSRTEFQVLEWLAELGVIGINRQLVPFTLRRQREEEQILGKLYSLLL